MSAALTATTKLPPDAVLAEVGEVKSLVRSLLQETRRAQTPRVPDALLATYQKLVANQVADTMARALVDRVRNNLGDNRLHDASAVDAELASALETMLPTAGPIQARTVDEPTVIALVGPTGVGKTTTIAKLAANLCLREHRRVGMITIDTYRIAAVAQLKTYAHIIDIPLEVATTPLEFGRALARMADCDFVLVDTAGRSQRDTAKLDELREFFDVARPHEVHLVLSGTSSRATLTEAAERFQSLGIDRVILTKLDEAVGFGVLLECLEKAGAALSYITTGQEVPDDIEVGESKRLAGMLLSGSTTRLDQQGTSDTYRPLSAGQVAANPNGREES